MEMVWRGRGWSAGCDVSEGWSGMHGRDAGMGTGVRSGRSDEGAGWGVGQGGGDGTGRGKNGVRNHFGRHFTNIVYIIKKMF